MKIVIVLPTYNENGNISLLLDALFGLFPSLGHEMHVLVVDDRSPDGTGETVSAMMGTRPRLHLLTGEKRGLGNAYIRGIRYALDILEADAVMEMDADFSHDPKDIPKLIGALADGADFVIGSRYVPGGSIPGTWGILRILISKWGNVLARHVVGLADVRDCTAGFRAISSTLLRRIDFGLLDVRGYSFQVTLLNQAMINRASIREIPVHFGDRTRGETKLSFFDILEFVWKACRLRLAGRKPFPR